IEGEMPFSDDDTSIVFRSLKNKKWIGIMMNIPSSRLNIPGEENVDVINLKHSQSMIFSLIDNRFIFPAWHMNKKTWITVLLSPDLDWDFFSSLLEESRRLVEERT
ncbi:MAG: MmcQ/YjbR family DNA-binding protein, partial [Candidatus Ornithospirochaeta sp.]